MLLQYKEAYDRELMQHGNTMQELVLVKQRLESEQESLAEADEAVRVAEAKLASSEVSNMCEHVCVRLCVRFNCVSCSCVLVYEMCVSVCGVCMLMRSVHTVRLIKKFTFRTVVNMHICVVHLTYLTLLLPRTYVLAGVRVVRVYRLKFLQSLAN